MPYFVFNFFSSIFFSLSLVLNKLNALLLGIHSETLHTLEWLCSAIYLCVKPTAKLTLLGVLDKEPSWEYLNCHYAPDHFVILKKTQTFSTKRYCIANNISGNAFSKNIRAFLICLKNTDNMSQGVGTAGGLKGSLSNTPWSVICIIKNAFIIEKLYCLLSPKGNGQYALCNLQLLDPLEVVCSNCPCI